MGDTHWQLMAASGAVARPACWQAHCLRVTATACRKPMSGTLVVQPTTHVSPAISAGSPRDRFPH
eukprot:6861015-Prorocentrum_lima.AAC.1